MLCVQAKKATRDGKKERKRKAETFLTFLTDTSLAVCSSALNLSTSFRFFEVKASRAKTKTGFLSLELNGNVSWPCAILTVDFGGDPGSVTLWKVTVTGSCARPKCLTRASAERSGRNEETMSQTLSVTEIKDPAWQSHNKVSVYVRLMLWFKLERADLTAKLWWVWAVSWKKHAGMKTYNTASTAHVRIQTTNIRWHL